MRLAALGDPSFEGVTEKLVVVGQGYVGLPLAIRAVEVGYDVVGFDLDTRRIERLAAGCSFVEDVSDASLEKALATGRYRPTTCADDTADFDVAVISVPTPLREHAPDLSCIESAANTLAPRLRRGATVVLESTTYPGTTEEIVVPLLESGSGLSAGVDFHVGYSPERIDPGNPTWGLVETPKVVSGIDDASCRAIQRFYDQVVDQTVPVSSTRVAELTKLLENTFRHVNIALVNELAMFASDLGIDVWEAIDAASTKPFGYLRFTPGPGVGGHCLPVDPSYLSWHVRTSLGHPFRFVELANDVNDHMPDYVCQRLLESFNRRQQVLNGSRVLLLGLTYKRNTSDTRESPSLAVARRLVQLGVQVVAADSHVRAEDVPPWVTLVALSAQELEGAHAVVLLVDHEDFDLDLVTSHARYIFDARRVTAGDAVEHL